MKRKIDGDTLHVLDDGNNIILSVKLTVAGNVATLLVSGSITHDAAPDFEDELMAVLTSDRDVIVDFSSLEHISAPALNTLLSVQRLVDEKRYKFYIQNITGAVKEIMLRTGFIDLIEIR